MRTPLAALRFAGGRADVSLVPPVLMGVLNVTPDSFSDGGRWYDPRQPKHVALAVEQGLRMAREGAAILDVGGESTRPGAERVDADEQTRRTVPVIRALREALDSAGFHAAVISIDTTLSAVAESALDAGASMLNDVSAGLDDAGMFKLSAGRGVPMVLMHMRGRPMSMQDAPRYDDVVGEVETFLLERARVAMDAGVPGDQVLLDPGIGFGKTLEHNLSLLSGLGRLCGRGHAVLLGTSRKSFIQKLYPPAVSPADRLAGSLATTALGVAAGVSVFRVHEVAEHAQALAVAWAWTGSGRGPAEGA